MGLRICAINDDQYPSKGANTINVMRTASALAEAGAEVDLVVPRLIRGHLSTESVCEHYGVPPNFNLIRLPSPAPYLRPWRPAKLSHALLAPWIVALKKADVIYSRNLPPVISAQMMGKPWVYETYRRYAEESPWLPRFTRLFSMDQALAAVAHSHQCAENLYALGFPREAILTAYNGYHPGEVEPVLDRREARKRCGLDPERPVVIHLGNMDPFIRLDVLLDIAVRIPEAMFLFVGGNPDQQPYWRNEASKRNLTNVHLVSKQPPDKVREYLYTADATAVVPRNADLVRPAGSFSISLYRILPGLPMKLMTYFPAGIPIFAPHYPYLCEVLEHERTAILYDPRSIDTAAAQLRELVFNPTLAATLGNNLRMSGKFGTWTQRGAKIYKFICDRLSRIRR